MKKKTKASQNFIVEIKCQDYHTWQGTITWVEGKKVENFRSTLELIKLMDSTLETAEKESVEHVD